MNQPILVGDVGGTSVRFALAHRGASGVEIKAFAKLAGDDFPSFEDAVASYLGSINQQPKCALFALAGVVVDGTATLTNRPWTIVSGQLEARFGLKVVRLVNDFAAMARAVPEMPAGRLRQIKTGQPVEAAPLLVAGAGTGLGIATLVPGDQGRWAVISGEGGHAAYAIRDEKEFAVAEVLKRRFGYVSNETVCSGINFEAVHEALCELEGVPFVAISPQIALDRAASGDVICQDICHIRARAIMGAAGDAALINGAWGGVVLAGGVTRRLLDYIETPESIARFVERGRHTETMSRLPIAMMEMEHAPLIGAGALYFDAAC